MAYEICIHHKDCPDGEAAAWIVRRQFPDVKLIGLKMEVLPGDAVEACRGKRIVICDTCPTNLVDIVEVGEEVLVLDHHITAQRILTTVTELFPDKLDYVWDMEHCGAVITWKWFNKDVEVPILLEYIEDRDLWKWLLPHSEEVNQALKKEHVMGDQLLDESLLPGLIERGTRYVLEMKVAIQAAAKHATAMKWKNVDGDDYLVWVVGYTGAHCSELGHYLVRTPFPDGRLPHFAIMWRFDVLSGDWWLSMRSETFDMQPLYDRFEGGGHPHAGGITLHRGNLRDYLDCL